MAEREFFSNTDSENAQGFRTILATEPCHDYIANWWPPGHVIGYEHEFTHSVVDFVDAVTNGTPIEPNFGDGLACMQVLEAGLRSARSGAHESVGQRGTHSHVRRRNGGAQQGQKILPLGAGDLDLKLLKQICDSGWRGPIGILNHTDHDAAERKKFEVQRICHFLTR